MVSSASMIAAFSGIDWVSWTDFSTWLGNVSSGNPVQLQVSVGAPTKKPGTNNVYDFPVSWTIGPKSNPPAPQQPMLNIKSLLVSYFVIFLP